MSDIVIIGGGFAGVWSALGAARVLDLNGADRSVTLVAPGADLVIRPRLYEPNPQDMRVPLDDVLAPVGVHRVAATVTGVDTAARRVTAIDNDGEPLELPYERLVLATGSALVRPDLPGAEHLFDVDTIETATALEEHLRTLPTEPGPGRTRPADARGRETRGPEAGGRPAAREPGQYTAVVVGAGFTGVEIATALVHRLRTVAGPAGDVRVILIERDTVIGPELGPGPRPTIAAALDELGIEVRLSTEVAKLDAESVTLSDGTRIPARTVVWTAGVRASGLTAQIPAERDHLGRLHVDEALRVTGVQGVYASGDTAAAVAEDGEHIVTQSCQHALQLGRYAGHNVAADLLGLPTADFTPDPYVTCLDLGAAGAVFTRGWNRTVAASGATAKKRKRTVNEEWIYPPVHDRTEILRRADYRVSTRGTTPTSE